jgi:hypothetical protein
MSLRAQSLDRIHHVRLLGQHRIPESLGPTGPEPHRCRGSVLERRGTAGFAIVPHIVSGSQGWPSTDTDELCRGCPANHAPGGGVRSGWSSCWRGRSVRHSRLRAGAGRGSIRTNSYGMSVRLPCSKPIGAQATALRCGRRAARIPSRTVETSQWRCIFGIEWHCHQEPRKLDAEGSQTPSISVKKWRSKSCTPKSGRQ